MTDVHKPEVRSYNMSRIKDKNTKPELVIRKYLHSQGFRFRLHDKRYAGKPDLILPKFGVAIFVNGCFWHGHKGCRYFVVPKTRTNWWRQKIKGNVLNDEEKVKELKKSGWNVITVWECDLKKAKRDNTLFKLTKTLNHIVVQ